jgi:predicted nucleotidyltransferase
MGRAVKLHPITPGGGPGSGHANAVAMEIDGMTIKVTALEDLIRMKEAAGRPKDRVELEILGALRDHLEEKETYISTEE